jgi:hypothetical protein
MIIQNWRNTGKLVTATVLILWLSGCAPAALRDESNSIQEYYRTHDKPEFQFSQHGVLKLRYLETGDVNKSPVVFIHGTPGSWAFLASYVNDEALQQDAHLIAIDRPGWGGSTLVDSEFEPGLVNPDHAAFAERALSAENLQVIRLSGEGHFFLYTNKELVTQQIRSLL